MEPKREYDSTCQQEATDNEIAKGLSQIGINLTEFIVSNHLTEPPFICIYATGSH